MVESNSTYYAAIYLILWVITLIVYWNKKKSLDLGLFTITMYTAYAICSLLLLFDWYFGPEYKDISFFPFLYLFVLEIITMQPILRYDDTKYSSIAPTDNRIINISCWVFILCVLFSLPSVFSNIGTGLVSLMVEENAGADLYESSALARESVVASGITNIPAVISGALSTICMFFAFYFLTINKNKLLTALLLSSVIVNVLGIIAEGHRGGVFEYVLQLLICYFIFKNYLGEKVKKIVKLVGFIFLGLIVFFVIVLTISRFEGWGSGASSSTVSYTGQANLVFSKYGLDDNGIRYGDRTIPMFKRMIGIDAPRNFTERRKKYPHLYVNDEAMCTYIGDFTIDYGPIGGAIILLLLSHFLTRKARCKSERIGLHNLLIIFITASVILPGGMALFNLADYGGLKIIVYVFFYSHIKRNTVLMNKKLLQNGENLLCL